MWETLLLAILVGIGLRRVHPNSRSTFAIAMMAVIIVLGYQAVSHHLV